MPDAHAVALVTEKVSESVREQLAAAGWSVTSVQTITSMHPDVVEDRWRDNYSKLHLFALLQYHAVMFIDADAVVRDALPSVYFCNILPRYLAIYRQALPYLHI